MFVILKKMLAKIFPATCILCHQPSLREQDLCWPCLTELPILPQNCPTCAKILTIETPEPCLNHDHAYVLFRYQTPLTKWIMELKFQEKILNARLLGELMTHALKQHWYVDKPLPEVIIPIPLHPRRIRERGFNQAVEIARPIAKALKIPIDTQSCHRQKHTAAQARSNAKKRRQNLQQAFTTQADFHGRHVAVLDDVMTTGQTLAEFTQMLTAAGAARVDTWCCAGSMPLSFPRRRESISKSS